MNHIPENEVVSVLTPDVAHREVRRTLSLWGTDGLSAPPRFRCQAGGRRLNVLTGLIADEAGGIWSGVKMYTADDGVGRGHMVVISAPDGEWFVVDATELGALRTGAISSVATEEMHGTPSRIALIGAGYQAERQARALHVLAPEAPIRIWNRTRGRADALAAGLSDEGADAAAVDQISAATAGADVVTILTRSLAPLLFLEHVEPGAHVNAAGSNHLTQCEIGEDLVDSSWIVVDSIEQAKGECGDLVPSLKSGAISWEGIAELGDLVREDSPSRETPFSSRNEGSRTLFESQGMGILDVALAAYVARHSTRK